MWTKIKNFIGNLINKINWGKITNVIKDFFKKYWLELINFIVLIIAFTTVYSIETLPLLEAILGVWIFVLIAYYVFWKLLFKREPIKSSNSIKKKK